MTSAALIIVMGALELMAPGNQTYSQNENYHILPKFWTSTGFCPAGEIGSSDLKQNLLSDAVRMNLQHIASLPNGAITHIRIHWLLELINFVSYSEAGIPIYDFDDLDTFIIQLDDLGLYPVIEFMANPGDVFIKNPNQNDFLWENFSFQVAKRYLNMLGASKMQRWRFESWNEPDLSNYNRLNFTFEDYLTYMTSLRKGLLKAGARPSNSLNFSLRGPAGLFKKEEMHPLCWSILEYCNENLQSCPLDILTYHRKGNGKAAAVIRGSSRLLLDIFEKYPELKEIPIANDEADPISTWSTPRPMQADVRYAHTLTLIVLKHWSAMLQQQEFKHFESLSHDNAFLSYHPYEFSQRTLLAHFRMNLSEPIHSQFIQKPVYAALALLGKLAFLAADLEHSETTVPGEIINLLKTTDSDKEPLYLSWLMLSNENTTLKRQYHNIEKSLPFELREFETYSFILEILEQHRTDPAWIWYEYGSPPYPNSTVRQQMRRAQYPILYATGPLTEPTINISMDFKLPWIMLLRVCSSLVKQPKAPQNLVVTGVNEDEVFITWREIPHTTNCLKSYEVWFKATRDGGNDWLKISDSWHVPYPSFHYAPQYTKVNGYYKVRAIDIFNRYSPFSEEFWYF